MADRRRRDRYCSVCQIVTNHDATFHDRRDEFDNQADQGIDALGWLAVLRTKVNAIRMEVTMRTGDGGTMTLAADEDGERSALFKLTDGTEKKLDLRTAMPGGGES